MSVGCLSWNIIATIAIKLASDRVMVAVTWRERAGWGSGYL